MTRKEYDLIDRMGNAGGASSYYFFSADQFALSEMEPDYEDQVDYLVFYGPHTINRLSNLYVMKSLLHRIPDTNERNRIEAHIDRHVKHQQFIARMEHGNFDMPDAESPPQKQDQDGQQMNERKINPIKWKGKANELAKVFFSLNEIGLIDIGPLPLAQWIVNSFVDANGKPLVLSTMQTNLRADRPEKRPSNARHLEADSLLSNESD